jgi:hypothetical protein
VPIPGNSGLSWTTLHQCATEPPQAALQRWESFLQEGGLETLPSSHHRLLPAVWKNLSQVDIHFPEEPLLRDSYSQSWLRNTRLKCACADVLDLLAAQGVPAVVLKGLAFESLLYDDGGVRFTSDIDLLVRPEHASLALQTLAAAGWGAAQGWPDPAVGLENAVALMHGEVVLDLHWFLLREARWPEADAALWRDKRPLEIGGRQTFTLSATHHLFHLVVAAGREQDSGVRYLLDLHLLARKHDQHLDLEQIGSLLRERHLLSRARGLPLEFLGLSELQLGPAPTRLDRLWSRATRYVFDGSHEWSYLLYPFLDYWLHFHGRSPALGLVAYLRAFLALKGPGDLWLRGWRKAWRLLRRPAA